MFVLSLWLIRSVVFIIDASAHFKQLYLPDLGRRGSHPALLTTIVFKLLAGALTFNSACKFSGY